MNESLPAFVLPFGPADAKYTRLEETRRRETLCRELRILVPAVDQLVSSRLVDLLAVRDGVLVLQFDLAFTGQLSLTDHALPVRALLERDLELLRRSLRDQQRAILVDAHMAQDGSTSPVPADAGNASRRSLLRRFHGRSLDIEVGGKNTTLHFPEVPLYRCDGRIHRVRAYIERVEAHAVRLYGVREFDENGREHPLTEGRRPKVALLPSGRDRLKAGMLCAGALLDRAALALKVRRAEDTLSGGLSHFEIVSVLRDDPPRQMYQCVPERQHPFTQET